MVSTKRNHGLDHVELVFVNTSITHSDFHGGLWPHICGWKHHSLVFDVNCFLKGCGLWSSVRLGFKMSLRLWQPLCNLLSSIMWPRHLVTWRRCYVLWICLYSLSFQQWTSNSLPSDGNAQPFCTDIITRYLYTSLKIIYLPSATGNMWLVILVFQKGPGK